MINIKKIIAFLIISLLSISGSYAKIEDAIYATVANKAITHSDIINEIKIILILNGQSYSEDRKEILLIKRRDVPVWVLPGGGIDSGESRSPTYSKTFSKSS